MAIKEMATYGQVEAAIDEYAATDGGAKLFYSGISGVAIVKKFGPYHFSIESGNYRNVASDVAEAMEMINNDLGVIHSVWPAHAQTGKRPR